MAKSEDEAGKYSCEFHDRSTGVRAIRSHGRLACGCSGYAIEMVTVTLGKVAEGSR